MSKLQIDRFGQLKAAMSQLEADLQEPGSMAEIAFSTIAVLDAIGAQYLHLRPVLKQADAIIKLHAAAQKK